MIPETAAMIVSITPVISSIAISLVALLLLLLLGRRSYMNPIQAFLFRYHRALHGGNITDGDYDDDYYDDDSGGDTDPETDDDSRYIHI